MITGCFHASLMCFAMMRPAISAPEPAVSGTMMRIARTGYSCANAVDTQQASNAAAANNFFMASPLLNGAEARGFDDLLPARPILAHHRSQALGRRVPDLQAALFETLGEPGRGHRLRGGRLQLGNHLRRGALHGE